ncbi:hypothetical protein [Cytobacillus horneckiae]|uniref:hypothetical protein n=1 Tax=Cytobacillus horneckiae TaxID=549687 RepID=UPI003D9A6941
MEFVTLEQNLKKLKGLYKMSDDVVNTILNIKTEGLNFKKVSSIDYIRKYKRVFCKEIYIYNRER